MASRSDRFPDPLMIGLVAIAASSLLLGGRRPAGAPDATQAVETGAGARTSGGGAGRYAGQAQSTTTQPATSSAPVEELQPAAPAADEASQPAARARLLSGLIGSKHDFTQEGQTGRNLCLPCHTPHLIAAPPPRLDRRTATTQPLRPYQGLNIELSGWSLLCLGCHDGVTAADVYSSSHAAPRAGQLANSRLGSRGLRSHPVGIRYPVGAEGYNPRDAVEAAGLLLPDGRVQCTTCHDAHNTNRHAHMLVISDERSRMCLTCHRL